MPTPSAQAWRGQPGGRYKERRTRKEKKEGRGDPSLRENGRMEGWRSQTQEGRPPGPNFAKRPGRA